MLRRKNPASFPGGVRREGEEWRPEGSAAPMLHIWAMRRKIPQRLSCYAGVSHRAARDDYTMASCWIPLLLALEVSTATRQAQGASRSSAADPGDEPCQSALGRSPHPWRAPQTRHRRRPDLSRQVHGAAKTTSLARLENVPPQPCRRDRLDRPLRGSDDLIQVIVRPPNPPI
jgi:hypothetical protein